MEYQIALSPDLGISPEEFVARWNELASNHEQSPARLEPPTSAAYDPSLLLPVLEVVEGILVGMAGSAFYDLLKQAVTKKGESAHHIRLERREQPDGSKVLIIERDEGE